MFETNNPGYLKKNCSGVGKRENVSKARRKVVVASWFVPHRKDQLSFYEDKSTRALHCG
jgi:hypothetical protein